MARKHSRIVQLPFAASLQGALLDSYEEEQRGEQSKITVKVRALERKSPELFERAGVIHERIESTYVPIQIHFSGVSGLKNNDFFTNLNRVPGNDSIRTIEDILSWRQPESQDLFVHFGMQASNIGSLMFFNRRVTFERCHHESTSITLERDWCPPPPMPERLVPRPKKLHQHFGAIRSQFI